MAAERSGGPDESRDSPIPFGSQVPTCFLALLSL